MCIINDHWGSLLSTILYYKYFLIQLKIYKFYNAAIATILFYNALITKTK